MVISFMTYKRNLISLLFLLAMTGLFVSQASATVHKSSQKVQKQDRDKKVISEEPKPAANVYHTIRKGDTLKSIAKKYTISESDIKEMNNLRSSKLIKGKKLLVKKIGPRTYIVKKGDSLSKIAKKFDMTPEDLMEINEMAEPVLTIGQKLYIEEAAEAILQEQQHAAFIANLEEELKAASESPELVEQSKPDRLILFAKKLLNIPYRFGGNSILGIDCSAYVKKVYGLLGVDLPRTAREQYKEGEKIVKDELSIGDLVFFRTYASFPSHVGIYLGNNLFIHASSKSRKVTINSLDTPYYMKRFIGGKRLLTETRDEETAAEPAS